MSYDDVITCHFCNREGKDYKLLKELTHGLKLVNRVLCPSCGNGFRLYWGERKDVTHFEHTIAQSWKVI